MPLIFPGNPSVNQTYQSGSTATYSWDGTKWTVVQPTSTTVVTAISASFASLATSASFATTASFASPSLTAFTDGGVTTIAALSGGLVKGSMATDRVYYRQKGAKIWEVVYNWYNNSGGTAGTGDYVFTLPNSLQFNSSALGQGFRTDGITGGQLNNGLGFAPAMMNTTTTTVVAIPYDATRFRVLIHNPTAGQFIWGSGYAPVSQLSIFKLQFEFVSL